MESAAALPLEPLGSGSDFTAFLDHLGIASLANADVLPFDFAAFARKIEGIVEEVAQHTDQMRRDTEQQNGWIAENLYSIIADRRHPFVPPEPQPPVPPLDFAPLRNAAQRLKSAARRYESATAGLSQRDMALPLEAAGRIDQALIQTERALTRPEGLPGRPWYRHLLYAPGLDTGYGAKTLPGVREAVEQRDFTTAKAQIAVAAEALIRCAEQVEKAAEILESVIARGGRDTPYCT